MPLTSLFLLYRGGGAVQVRLFRQAIVAIAALRLFSTQQTEVWHEDNDCLPIPLY